MPPIGYPGNSISKEARAKAGGGFESAIEVVPTPTGAPSINSVTDNGDGTLTISGSNFGNKVQAAPFKFDRFEGAAGQALSAYDPDWVEYSDGGTTIRSERSHSGTTCVGNTTPGDASFATNYFIYPQSDVVRGAYWVYVDAAVGDDYQDGSTTQIKLTRITSTSAAGGDGPYNGAGDFVWGGTTFTLNNPAGTAEGPISRNNGVDVLAPSGRFMNLEKNAWNRIDMLVKLSDPGVANGAFGIMRSCPLLGTAKVMFENQVTVGAGQNFKQNAIILGLMIANYSSEFSNPLSVFIDDVYVDGTWAAVEIGDNPDYLSCTRRDALPPTAWSGNSVTVSENFGPVPSGTNYIFVTNENGEVNSVGYEVTI